MSHIHNPTIAYRPEIDGLRAIAVLAVIFYHAGFRSFSGGFVGVDIFFVISGYLISTIILKEIRHQNFSIPKFYARRAKRLLPAAAFVNVICLIAGWFLLLPYEYNRLGQSLVSSSVFISNYFFWMKTDYFAPAANTEILLHTWSLSVEEQFYLIFPVILLFLRKRKPGKTYPIIILLLIISFAIWVTLPGNALRFYGIHTRAWELLGGTLLAIQQQLDNRQQLKTHVHQYLGTIGILLVILPLLFGTTTEPYNSVAVVSAVVGTSIIILLSNTNGLVKEILSARYLVFVGTISYSLYLWHQPLFAFINIFSLEEKNPIKISITLTLLFFLAYATTVVIENPIRKSSTSQRTVFFATFLSTASLILLGTFVYIKKGIPERLDQKYAKIDWDKHYVFNNGIDTDCLQHDGMQIKEHCKIGNNPDIVLWGDSFAAHWAPGLKELGAEFYQFTKGNCPPFVSIHRDYYPSNTINSSDASCLAFNDKVMKEVKDNQTIKTVILSSNFAFIENNPDIDCESKNCEIDIHSVVETVNVLQKAGKRVAVILPTPMTYGNPSKCVQRYMAGLIIKSDFFTQDCQFDINKVKKSQAKIKEKIENLAKTKDFKLIDPASVICVSRCNPMQNDTLVYFDQGHLTTEGSIIVAKKMRESFLEYIEK